MIRVISVLALLALAGAARADDRLENIYWAKLDAWLIGGGNVQTIQSEIVETCGKLTMVTATKSEVAGFLTTEREEFDWRVDVCAKATVNRVHPQPEFEDPKIVSTICDNSVELFKKVCKHSGLTN